MHVLTCVSLQGLAIRPKESEIIVIMEDIYEQILWHKAIKDSYTSKGSLKATLRAFTFNFLDIHDKSYIHDSKFLKVFSELREKFVILKPDKGQGTVLVTRGYYVNSIQRIFHDASKFKKIEKYPTIIRLTTVQNYLKTLCKRGKITKSEKKAMRPKFAQIEWAHGLRKHINHLSNYQNLDQSLTIETCYGISKFLSDFLNLLAENQYVVKDSFTATNMIRKIWKELFDQGYQVV